jgi:hypothetical protein
MVAMRPLILDSEGGVQLEGGAKVSRLVGADAQQLMEGVLLQVLLEVGVGTHGAMILAGY